MAFKYNPPTRTLCEVCEKLSKVHRTPVIHTQKGKASSANNFPFHNWYNFVLGYSPEFPEYLINKFKIGKDDLVVDPFMGTGTTLVTCKEHGIKSSGLDANDYFIDVAKTKLNWALDSEKLSEEKLLLITTINKKMNNLDFEDDDFEITLNQKKPQLQLGIEDDVLVLEKTKKKTNKVNYKAVAEKQRTKLLDLRYISDKPLAKFVVIKKAIEDVVIDAHKPFFMLALSSIIVPISNIRYGPGFGVGKKKEDVDVLKYFNTETERMISDIKNQKIHKHVKANVFHGDARKLDEVFDKNSVDFMITSPPYPGDHEYTKHTKLELILMDYAVNLEEFRVIKKRMVRGSTTNIYKEDNERDLIQDIKSIHKVTDLIDERLKHDGATSGFEKLYTKLVWEYFGGMFNTFKTAHKVLLEQTK